MCWLEACGCWKEIWSVDQHKDMILVDDGDGAYERIDHSPWNECTLADFVMPFFLFIVGVAIAFALKRVPNIDIGATVTKIALRTLKMLFWGVLLQGLHIQLTEHGSVASWCVPCAFWTRRLVKLNIVNTIRDNRDTLWPCSNPFQDSQRETEALASDGLFTPCARHSPTLHEGHPNQQAALQLQLCLLYWRGGRNRSLSFLYTNWCLGLRTPFLFLEWIGMNAMLVFVLGAQGILAVFVNGWYYKSPDNSLVHWIVKHVFVALTKERVPNIDHQVES